MSIIKITLSNNHQLNLITLLIIFKVEMNI